MFLGFLPKDTLIDYLIKEHTFWPSPSASSESWGKKWSRKVYGLLIILGIEVSNHSWEPLKFLLLRDKKTVGANTVESSDSLKCVWPEFYKSLRIL